MDSLPPEGPGFFNELIKRRLKVVLVPLSPELSTADGDGSALDDKLESRGIDILKHGQQDVA